MTETEAKIISDMNQIKSLIIHYSQREDWNRVTELVEEIKVLKAQRVNILESKYV